VGPTCAKHLKESTGCGVYEDRYAAWEKKELYCVVINEKEIKEKQYGTYLHGKKLDSSALKEELDKWGIAIQLDVSLFRPPPKPVKKNRGRKPERKVESTESDSEDLAEADVVETKVLGPDPKAEAEAPAEAEASEAPEAAAPEAPVEPKEKKKKEKKEKKVKVEGTSLDAGELVREEMEEKPKKKKKEKKESQTQEEE